MAKYGEFLDLGYDPYKEKIFEAFSQYFNNLQMTKIKDVENYSMYMAKIFSQLGIEYRYVIIFIVKDDKPIGSTQALSEMRWVTLQTRSLHDNHKLPNQTYIPRRQPSLMKKITLIKRDVTQYTYRCDDYPLLVTLLPTKKDSTTEYNQTGSIVTALESYNTIVSWVE